MTMWCVIAMVCGSGATARAQADREDRSIVFELGAAADWEAKESVHYGGTFAFELTPIEHWLELEMGATPIAAGHGMDVSFDVLFKKPWQPSRSFEFMIGAGPELIRSGGPHAAVSWGAEGVLDFMFWPRRNVGWYVEPAYEMVWHDGAPRHGAGIAVGILMAR